MSTVKLNWEPLVQYIEFKIIDETHNKAIPGVYIWGFVSNARFNPYYVGKAKDIFMRIAQHFAYITGGLYAIFPKEQLLDLKILKNTRDKKFNEENAAFWPKDLKRIYEFKPLSKESKEHITWMANNMYFTYAILENSDERVNAEKYLLKSIGLQNLINTRGGSYSKSLVSR